MFGASSDGEYSGGPSIGAALTFGIDGFSLSSERQGERAIAKSDPEEGITWQEAQGKIGEGGQAVIYQSQLSRQDIFAFKRCSPWKERRNGEIVSDAIVFRELQSEISILGHPIIRSHPNIVSLEGICWEIKQSLDGTESVWPVRIFEKASHKDLDKFMRSKEGAVLSPEKRLCLCLDLAAALDVMHANDIIHGDVKPENSLIFDDGTGGHTAKLTDFGYSTIALPSCLVDMPRSIPWVAPEWHIRRNGYTLSEAKRMDVYSFGMLCLWVLFREKLDAMGILMRTNEALLPKSQGPTNSADVEPSHQDIATLEGLRRENDAQRCAFDLVNSSSYPADLKPKLSILFGDALSIEPEERHHSFCDILGIFGRERISQPSLVADLRLALPERAGFQVAKELQTLCLSDHRIRRHIFHCLEWQFERSSGLLKLDTAFQLAFCAKIGFGTLRGEAEASAWLAKSNYLRDMQQEVESTRTEINIFNPKFRKLYDKGVLRPINHAQEFLASGDMDAIQSALEKEIAEMEAPLGKSHPAILNLKWTWETMLQYRHDPRVLDLLREMGSDLDADRNYGENSLERALVNADMSITLLRSGDIQRSEELRRQAYNSITRIAGHDHMVALIIGMNMVMDLDYRCRSREATELLESVIGGFRETLGDSHPATVSAGVQLSKFLMQEGEYQEAIVRARYALNALKEALGANDVETMQCVLHLISLLKFSGQFADAEEEMINYVGDLDEKSPHYRQFVVIVQDISADIAILQHRYKESVSILERMLLVLRASPWPPAQRPLVSLQPDYPSSPEDLPQNPALMIALVRQSIALQAEAQLNERAGSRDSAKHNLDHASRNIRELMHTLNNVLQHEDWSNIDLSGGIAGSALHAAMNKGHCELLQILVLAGAENAHEGLHYDQAIKIAEAGNQLVISSILREHRQLCGGIPSDPSFATWEEMRLFIGGNWRGSYLYNRGGYREDKTGLRRLTFTVPDNPKGPPVERHSLAVDGIAVDDMGRWIIQGTVSMSGKIILRFFLEGEEAKKGWEYRGYININRQAMGGSWGMPAAHVLDGTFFFFKDSATL